jgi:hypothetical protein
MGGNSPLMVSIISNLSIFRELINAGADINHRRDKKSIFDFCIEFQLVDRLILLIQNGVDYDSSFLFKLGDDYRDEIIEEFPVLAKDYWRKVKSKEFNL